MLNYYDEIKEAVIEALEEEEMRNIINQAENKDDVYYDLYNRFFVDDAITGNASGSYYFNSYKARKHCYEFFRDVFGALEEFCYEEELEKFKFFVGLVEEGYLNIENMTINYDILEDEDERCYVFYTPEDMKDLDFEKLDVITRCYMLSSVLSDVLDNYLD